MRSAQANGFDHARPLRALEIPGFTLREAVYEAAREIPPRPHEGATLCLTIDGGYQLDWGRSHVRCGPAALVFHPPGEVYGARILEQGSRCMTVGIDPEAFISATAELPDLERLRCTRRAPPRWLAFHLRRELDFGDDLSATSVENAVVALLAEISGMPGLETSSASPPWLTRVREQIDDEFGKRHTLETLALTAGVHRVHLAREFRRNFACTVGQYIRQRRIEFACHRLIGSRDPLSRIALDAGFADQSHFTNTFRMLVGTTPRAFRARLGTHAARSGPRR